MKVRREASVVAMKRAYSKQLRISRERFASTVKRDKLKNASQADLDLIQDGNDDYFHGGNCVLDMDIWEPTGNRKDLDTFQYLYGLNPPQVERTLLSSETVDALDDHAAIIASKLHAPTEFHVRFSLFVQELIASDFPCFFLSEPNNRVTKLYWEFREAINRVPPGEQPQVDKCVDAGVVGFAFGKPCFHRYFVLLFAWFEL